MKRVSISRFVVVAAVLALMSAPLFAQISFPSFTSTNITGLTLNGAAATNNPNPLNVLRLTPSQTGQMGSAFFTTQQTVLGTFSTTFTFQLGGSSTYTADGFAFVIQNSAATALGPDGCGIGFGGGGNNNCASNTGIPKSLAVEFDTYQNTPDDPNNNHVSIQTCLTAANLTDKSCRIADNSNPMNGSGSPVTLADGNPHSVSVSFTPSGSCTNTACLGVLDVALDGNDLFPGAPAGEDTPAVPEGVSFDITTIGLNNGSAWVGFTAATGGGDDNQDIVSWTFSPNTQTIPLPAPGTQGTTNFNGGVNSNSFDQTATIDLNSPVTSASLNVKPILIDKNSCNKLVHQTFPLAQCFVFENADGKGTKSAVFFELNCTNAQGNCSSSILATLGNDFVFQYSDNPGFNLFNSTIGAYVGVLKGETGSPNGSCQIDSTHPLKFVSNQISKFTLTNDPVGGTTQKAHPGTSCWTIVWGATGELPPGITITAPASTNYPQGIAPAPTTLPASYNCTNPSTSKDPNANNTPVGPYLTVGSCTQSQAPNNLNTNTCNPLNTGTFATSGLACNGLFDVSAAGLHLFVVTAKDTAGNVNAKAVVYNVQKPKH